MRVMGIFNGQVVEAKFFLNFAQRLLVGFEQANPDKSVFVFELFANVRNHYICHTNARGVGGAVNHSRTLRDFRRVKGCRILSCMSLGFSYLPSIHSGNIECCDSVIQEGRQALRSGFQFVHWTISHE
jgi:hypothetical protein